MLRPSLALVPSLLAAATWAFAACVSTTGAAEEKQWLTYDGKEGAGKGKHLVLIAGDDEYHSEEGIPVLARILAERHGFSCTVLFAINKQTGMIDPGAQDNIPGLEALDHADGMVIFTRFRNLPDDQMKHVVDYIDSGHGVIGMRTATHAFNIGGGTYAKYSFNSGVAGFDGGFGRLVLGETWINHHGGHGSQSTSGLLAPGIAGDPIVNGIADGDIWCATDVYQVRLPLLDGCRPVIMGQVLSGMDPKDKPVVGGKNEPMMPVAWTRTYTGPSGKPARVFTTTMGGAMSGHQDWDNEALRRLLVNATYWVTGLEKKIPAKADVTVFTDHPVTRGHKPQEFQP